ncbi:MAG: PLD nuclease N-terminal domain-containing protein [Pseudomonadota bacterium]
MLEVAGLGSVILMGLNIWALISIIGANVSTGTKVLWSLLVLILPVIGFIAWLLAGPRGKPSTA